MHVQNLNHEYLKGSCLLGTGLVLRYKFIANLVCWRRKREQAVLHWPPHPLPQHVNDCPCFVPFASPAAGLWICLYHDPADLPCLKKHSRRGWGSREERREKGGCGVHLPSSMLSHMSGSFPALSLRLLCLSSLPSLTGLPATPSQGCQVAAQPPSSPLCW